MSVTPSRNETMALRMARWLLPLALAAVLTAALAGCGEEPAPLAGTSWVLTSLGAADSPTAALAGAEATAVFQADGTISGRGGCNSYGGDYRTDGGTVSLDSLSWTERACSEPEGNLEQETRFFNLLANSGSFEIEGDTLTLKTSGGEVVVFSRSGN